MRPLIINISKHEAVDGVLGMWTDMGILVGKIRSCLPNFKWNEDDVLFINAQSPFFAQCSSGSIWQPRGANIRVDVSGEFMYLLYNTLLGPNIEVHMLPTYFLSKPDSPYRYDKDTYSFNTMKYRMKLEYFVRKYCIYVLAIHAMCGLSGYQMLRMLNYYRNESCYLELKCWAYTRISHTPEFIQHMDIFDRDLPHTWISILSEPNVHVENTQYQITRTQSLWTHS